MKKFCKKCSTEKSHDCFYKQSKNSDGLRSVCKLCEKIRKLSTYDRQKEVTRKKGCDTKRRAKDLNFKLRQYLRSRVSHAIKNCQKTGSAIRDLGCSIEELKKHLESQFQPGMSWDNYGRNGWHIDHIVPLVSFDLSNRDEFVKASSYKNLQPLWAKDNLRKSGKNAKI